MIRLLVAAFVGVSLPAEAGIKSYCMQRLQGRSLHPMASVAASTLQHTRFVSDVHELSDIEAVAQRTFATDPLFAYVAPQHPQREAMIRSMVRHTWFRGDILVNKEGPIRGFALWHDVQSAQVSVLDSFLNGQWRFVFDFPFAHLRMLMDFDQKLSSLRQEACARPCLYLYLLGVDPAFQRQGYGKMLLGEALAVAQQAGKSVVLEIQKTENEAYYRAFGFSEAGRFLIPGSNIVSQTLRWSPR